MIGCQLLVVGNFSQYSHGLVDSGVVHVIRSYPLLLKTFLLKALLLKAFLLKALLLKSLLLKALLLVLFCLWAEPDNGQAETPEDRPRARDIGLVVGVFDPGPVNAITDVKGVEVGHMTKIVGDDIRTGVSRLPGKVGCRKVHTRRNNKQVPGHHIQMDVKVLRFKNKAGKKIKRYQYTAIGDATRVRAL